jgi:DNA-directed RNA polymerase specialized sigma subunit
MYRAQRHVVSLDERLMVLGSACFSLPPAQDSAGSANTAILQAAVEEALSAQTAEQRFLLASYFFDGRTSADIGRSIGVHESTVSRRLDQTLKDLRTRIKRNLCKCGMSSRQVVESFQNEGYEIPSDIRGLLLQGRKLANE